MQHVPFFCIDYCKSVVSFNGCMCYYRMYSKSQWLLALQEEKQHVPLPVQIIVDMQESLHSCVYYRKSDAPHHSLMAWMTAAIRFHGCMCYSSGAALPTACLDYCRVHYAYLPDRLLQDCNIYPRYKDNCKSVACLPTWVTARVNQLPHLQRLSQQYIMSPCLYLSLQGCVACSPNRQGLLQECNMPPCLHVLLQGCSIFP